MSNRIVQRYVTVDQKVELLIERMSTCVRLVTAYMRDRTPAEHMRDRIMFGEMLRDFVPCIAQLRRNRLSLRLARRSLVLLAMPLWSERATILERACAMIYYFDNHNFRLAAATDLLEIRNEMKNLLRFEKNLYPRLNFTGFTHLNTRHRPLIKFVREETGYEVVVSEAVYNKMCVVCLERERDVVLYPCTHCCLCRECKDSVHICPICRSSVRQVVHTDDADRERRPYIMSTQFQGSEGDMSSLLRRLQALSSEH
jgi:hypothetical protein